VHPSIGTTVGRFPLSVGSSCRSYCRGRSSTAIIPIATPTISYCTTMRFPNLNPKTGYSTKLYSTTSSSSRSDTTTATTTSQEKKSHQYSNRNNKKRRNGKTMQVHVTIPKPKPKSKTYKEIKQMKQAKEALLLETKYDASAVEKQNMNDMAKDKDEDSKMKRDTVVERQKEKSNVSRMMQIERDDENHDHDTREKKSDTVTRRIHNMNQIKSSRTMQEKMRSMERLQKASMLLQDVIPLDDISAASSSSSSSSGDSGVDGATLHQDESPFQLEDDTFASSIFPSGMVPDDVWYNGNLQRGKGDYVTRWAKGVKVAEPLRKYDPVAAEKLLFLQPAKWIVRNVQIGFPLALWAFGVAWDVVTNKEEENRIVRAKQLLDTVSGLGPAIIKGGQALASRSDLMPSEYLDQLQKLQDDVPRFENQVALGIVEKELGVDFDDVFELVDPEPVAAASIGQVYKARLRSNGDLVALKIQRPNCEEIIALDLYVLRWWSGVANILTRLLNRDINVQSIIDDFGELIYRELDYVAEAANAQRFSELYASQVKDVFVPKIYSELTTSKVLTMEWVEGFRLTDSETLDKYGLDRKKLVDTLVQCSLRQILGNGFFHADPHAGNLLVVPDGRLCYLDFGMMSYAASEQRNGFLLAVVHIVNRDWDELVSMYQRLGFIPEGTDLKPIAVALDKSLPDALNSDISELNFKNVVGKLGDIMYTYPFSLPPFYIAIIRCLGVLEGLAIQVDPQARIISEAYPYVASRVLTDSQDELQEALRRLALTNDGRIRWDRLESLLSKAKGSQDYDASLAVDQLTKYLISDDGEQLLLDFTNRIVDGADSLGFETIGYIIDAAQALAINNEVAAVRAFTTLQHIFAAVAGDEESRQKVQKDLRGVLPEPTPSMQQFWRISVLLGARGGGSNAAKLIPIIRRLSNEPKIQQVASEIAARLGERILSRSLRALFGLPQPSKKE